VAVATEWPDEDKYYLAVQAPHVFFTSPRLKKAVIANDELGLPMFATGGSAIVFQATMGSADVAIRCFTRSVPSRRQRYRTFSEYLTADGRSAPRCFVRFAYLDEEILVDGSLFPVVEMGWADGSALHDWVARNYERADRLRALAGTWLAAMNDLHGRQIAHGDLANDNCLVASESDITLIDYDGCYVPELAHANPGEDGHPNFRHPRRAGYYGPNMDAFPALVIYLSLLAVAADQTLWNLNQGESHLLFTVADYEQPGGTEVWHRLLGSGDGTVVALTQALADMCTASVAELPPLGQVVTRPAPPRRRPEPPDGDGGRAGHQPPKAGREDQAPPRPLVEAEGIWWERDTAGDDLPWEWPAAAASPASSASPPSPSPSPFPFPFPPERDTPHSEPGQRWWETHGPRLPPPEPVTFLPPPPPTPRPRSWFRRTFDRLFHRSHSNP
jgi:hypothetical protein